MPMSSIYSLLDDIQEFCFIMTHTLQLHELLNFWVQQISVVRNRVLNGVKEISNKTGRTLKDNCYMQQHETKLFSRRKYSSERSLGQLSSQKFQDIAQQLHLREVLASYDDVFKDGHSALSATGQENIELKQKISSLEENIASLIKAVENLSNKTSCYHSCSSNLPTMAAPPPPPPPPPPPAPKNSNIALKKTPRLCALSENNLSIRSPMKMDMNKILKGLKDVKLKPTERSPGGTPMRRRSPTGNNDTIDIFKAALKRRFASIHPEDFSSNKENFDESWESSPNRSFMS